MVKVALCIALLVVTGLLYFSYRPGKDRGALETSPPAVAVTPDASASEQTSGAGDPAPTDPVQPSVPDLSSMTAALVAAIPKEGTPEELFAATCAACHGAMGEGNAALKAPSIAGLPDWFALIQFEKFRNGQRGEGEGDIGGHYMKAIAEAIDEERLPGLGKHIAALPIVPTRNSLGGDPAVGKVLFLEHCAGCHRYNAHGEKVFRSAPLSGLQDWYIFDTLVKYREEIRGYHSFDVDGIFMHRNLKSVSDDDFKQIIAYIAELAEKFPPAERRPRSRETDGSNAPVR
jgi:cytochrome c oxidase subunit 2